MRRHQGGVVALEFALVLPIALLLVFGLLHTGFYVLASATAQNAAREAVRHAVVPQRFSRQPAYPALSEIQAGAAEAVPAWVRGSVGVDVIGAALPGSAVTVTVTYSDIPLFVVLDRVLDTVGVEGAISITRSASARRE